MPDHAPAPAGRRIALIAHDNKKQDMIEWAEYNLDLLAGHELFATATTGHLLQQQLGLPVTCFRSGPYGGDQQIGARIAEGEIDLLVFLWDPLEPHPHDPDVKALLRVAVVCNIPVACNRATADFMNISARMSVPSAVAARRQNRDGKDLPQVDRNRDEQQPGQGRRGARYRDEQVIPFTRVIAVHPADYPARHAQPSRKPRRPTGAPPPENGGATVRSE